MGSFRAAASTPLVTTAARAHGHSEVVNAIFYVMRSGCPWRLLPADFPPWRTVYRWFAARRDAGLFERVNHALVMADREGAGRQASPTAAVIDSQSIKTTERGAKGLRCCQEGARAQAPRPGGYRRARSGDRSTPGDIQDRCGSYWISSKLTGFSPEVQ